METELTDRVRAYLRALETWDSAAVAAFYAEDAVQIEHPNRFKPQGGRRRLPQMLEDLERGRGLLRRQSYQVRALIGAGETVAAQLSWRGELAVPLGDLPEGAEMQAETAIFFRFRAGSVVEQQNYDCVVPPAA